MQIDQLSPRIEMPFLLNANFHVCIHTHVHTYSVPLTCLFLYQCHNLFYLYSLTIFYIWQSPSLFQMIRFFLNINHFICILELSCQESGNNIEVFIRTALILHVILGDLVSLKYWVPRQQEHPVNTTWC